MTSRSGTRLASVSAALLVFVVACGDRYDEAAAPDAAASDAEATAEAGDAGQPDVAAAEDSGSDAAPRRKFLYVFAGARGSLTGAFDASAYRAEIASDGTLGAWEPTAELDLSRREAAFVATDDGVVVAIGGETPVDAYAKAVSFARLPRDGGRPTAWAAAAPLALGRRHAAAVFMPPASVLLVAGTSSEGYLDDVDIAAVGADGSKPFSPIGALPVHVAYHGAAWSGARLVVAGGRCVSSSNELNTCSEVWSGTFQPAMPTTWRSEGKLSIPVQEPAMVAFDRVETRLLVIGGFDASGIATTAVQLGVGPPNGSIGWSAATPLPSPGRARSCAVVDGHRVYVLGGHGGNLQALDEVLVADIRAPSASAPTVSTWRRERPMPTKRTGFGCAVF